jgi:quercetin dioxygenase-like cupin family protein
MSLDQARFQDWRSSNAYSAILSRAARSRCRNGLAAAQTPVPSSQQHIVLPTTQMKWGPSPPGLPAGAQTAVLSGDPNKAGEPFTISVKMPDGYVVRPHWHPTAENMVVISGSMKVGTGDSFNEASMTELGPGGYGMMAPKTRHYVKAKGATTVVLTGWVLSKSHT